MPKKSNTAVAELRIGPYAGGINTYSDVSAIADDEMSDCVNFDIDLDGSLKSRPPWGLLMSITEDDPGVSTPSASFQEILYSGAYETVRFIIFTSNHNRFDGPGIYIYYVDGPNAGQTFNIAAGLYLSVQRYANDLFFIPAQAALDTQGGYKYILSTGLVTAIPTMPKGDVSVIYKERLWISGRRFVASTNSRVFFSELANFAAAWSASNFFDINPGDGSSVNEMLVYQDNLLIFKDGATYVLSYDSGPAQAVLQLVNGDIGAQESRAVVAYENSVFVYQYNRVYEMQNYDFTRISVKVPFEYDTSVPATGIANQAWAYPRWMRLCGDRLVVRFYNIVYVYHLRLRAWSRWESDDPNISGLGPIVQFDGTSLRSELREGHQSYIATSSLRSQYDSAGVGSTGAWKRHAKIFVLEDRYESFNLENGNITPPATPFDIRCSLLTKAYDMGISHRFKRLMHWGVDTITGRSIVGTTYPFTIAYKVTWRQLHIYRWHELNTWGYPLFKIPSIEQEQPIGAGIARRYIRFPKSLRFRLVQFGVDMKTVGNVSDGPARLYSVTAFVSSKQLVPKVVN